MAIEEKIPKIQDALRKKGYPRLNIRNIQNSVQDAQGQQQKVEFRHQWEFVDKESRASILIDAGGITYQVTKYDVFETLISAFEEALDVFTQYVEPDLVMRIGIRYVDLVIPKEGKQIRDYFSSSLRGFQFHESVERDAFFTETVCKTGSNSKFIHRYVEALKGFAFPPDLLPVSLTFPRDPKMSSSFGLLDLDHFMMLDEDFSVKGAISHLHELHAHQTNAFKASVTPEAIDEWKLP